MVTSRRLYIGDLTRQVPPHCGSALRKATCKPHDEAHRPTALGLAPTPVIVASPRAAERESGACPAATSHLSSPSLCSSFEDALAAESAHNGFLVDYVIHVQERVGGPHSIEVKLGNVRVYWPFLADLKLVSDIILVYSHFAQQRFVHRNLPNTTDARWMFVNVVLTDGQLLVSSPTTLPLGDSTGASWQPAAALCFEVLRVGYDWGASQELILRVSLQKLGVSLVKQLHLGLVCRNWSHRAGLLTGRPGRDCPELAHPELLKPVSGQVRWHACRPPGHAEHGDVPDANSRASSVAGSHASAISHATSMLSVTSRTLVRKEEAKRDAAWSTSHSHELLVQLEEVLPQIVLSSRWHLKSILDALHGRHASPGRAALVRTDHAATTLGTSAGGTSLATSFCAQSQSRSRSTSALAQAQTDQGSSATLSGLQDRHKATPRPASTWQRSASGEDVLGDGRSTLLAPVGDVSEGGYVDSLAVKAPAQLKFGTDRLLVPDVVRHFQGAAARDDSYRSFQGYALGFAMQRRQTSCTHEASFAFIRLQEAMPPRCEG